MALRGIFYFGFKLIYVDRKVRIRCKSLLSIHGGGTRLLKKVIIDALSRDGVQLGTHCAIGKHTYIHCGREGGGEVGLGKGLVAGDNVQIGAFSHFNCSGGIEIGDNCLFGGWTFCQSENHNFNDPIIPICKQGLTRKGIKIG
jgi:acetyltransferase-like isoleucine patch superfamily enzyme